MSKKVKTIEQELKKSNFKVRSAYVKFGKTFEQFAPFTNQFSQEEKSKFIFLGCPIDGVIFGENNIQFIEIKTGNSMLSQKQERIKKLVEEGKVKFKEVRY